MNNALIVSILKSVSHLNKAGDCLVSGERTVLLDQCGQIGPVDILHHQEVSAVRLVGVVCRDNVGVVKFRHRTNLTMKSLHGVRGLHTGRGHDFKCNNPVHPPMHGL